MSKLLTLSIGSFVLSSENFGTMRDTLIIKEPQKHWMSARHELEIQTKRELLSRSTV